MFVLGHLGIGSWLAARRVRADSIAWLLFGAVLPDLIDKPLYYALSFATGRHGAALGLISSTRTFGHTLILAFALYALLPRRIGTALLAGIATHLALDGLGDLVGFLLPEAVPRPLGPSVLSAILFPLLGWRFPVIPFATLREHAGVSLESPWMLGSELLGAALLVWQWRTGVFSPLQERLRKRGAPARSG